MTDSAKDLVTRRPCGRGCGLSVLCSGNTALMLAARHGQSDSVGTLLAAGAEKATERVKMRQSLTSCIVM